MAEGNWKTPPVHTNKQINKAGAKSPEFYENANNSLICERVTVSALIIEFLVLGHGQFVRAKSGTTALNLKSYKRIRVPTVGNISGFLTKAIV